MRFLAFLLGLLIANSVVCDPLVASQRAASAASETTLRTIADRLDAYEQRLDTMKQEALARGRVSYSEVLEAAYGPAVLTPQRIALKMRQYRADVAEPFTDYSRIHVSVPVHEKGHIAGKAPGSRLWGQYNFGRHQMFVDQTAHANVIIHEAGHVLQRKELINRRRMGLSVVNNRDAERVEEAAKLGVISESRSNRIRYLIRRDEMDVRLQDLNRFFANAVSDRPILSHQDALEALYAIGVDPTVEEVRAACALAGIDDVQPRAHPTMISDPRVDTLFDDAAELRELCYWSKRAGGALWPDVLARILRQAPHHF